MDWERMFPAEHVKGVDWVKTSTGYASSRATMQDLELIREHTPMTTQVKAAGGIRDLDAMLAVRAIGVSRVGTTHTETMLEEGRGCRGLQPISSHLPVVPAGGF
jgi:deoxyribose-phosphate aldolase